MTGIILAGGKSSRMGMEKGLVVFRGQPLIHWSISVLKESCNEILISSNSDCYNYLGFKVVADIFPDIGPMGGIYSCLVQSADDINLVLSCDMPFVTPEIFKLMIAEKGDSKVCVPGHEGEKYEPLCGIYQKSILEEMNVFIQNKNYKLPDLFRQTNAKILYIHKINPSLPKNYFLNINRPEDLSQALSPGLND
jgi:molybdenum cofactor guanylyltransferase